MDLQCCERDVAEAEKGSSDEVLSERIIGLSWALIHSRRSQDVRRGIAMIEGEQTISLFPFRTRWDFPNTCLSICMLNELHRFSNQNISFDLKTCLLQLRPLALTAQFKSERSFIRWLLATTELGTIQGAEGL